VKIAGYIDRPERRPAVRKDGQNMKKMYRFTFVHGYLYDEVEAGGCVLAFSEKQAIKKVKKFCKFMYPFANVEKGHIAVWFVGFSDIYEIKPPC
jgi:hypothetical protein